METHSFMEIKSRVVVVMTIKACRAKARVSYATCSHCHKQIIKGQWVVGFAEERRVVHEKCFEAALAEIKRIREGWK